MRGAHYEWSPIRAGTADKPIDIERGDQVSKSDLKLSDADWQALIDAGSIRTKQFPAPKNFPGSAGAFVRQQLREATEMSAAEEEEAAFELAHISERSRQLPEGGSGEGA